MKSWPIWECEPSKFQWKFDEKEICLIIEGQAKISTQNGAIYFIKDKENKELSVSSISNDNLVERCFVSSTASHKILKNELSKKFKKKDFFFFTVKSM